MSKFHILNEYISGVSNRNKGLEWIMEYGEDDAVAYFADDDNTYDIRLFNEVSLFLGLLENVSS